MPINKDLLYNFLLEKTPLELKMKSFQSWFDWYVQQDLINIEFDEKNNISKVLFIRKLYDKDIECFPLYASINMGDLEKIFKFYTHRPDGNVYYVELLLDREKDHNYIFNNYRFGFLYIIKKFNFNPYEIKENERILYFKKGRRTITNLCEHKESISTIINGER